MSDAISSVAGSTVSLELLVVKDIDNRFHILEKIDDSYRDSHFEGPYNARELRGVISNSLELDVTFNYVPNGSLPNGFSRITQRDIGEIEGKRVPVLVAKDNNRRFYFLLKGERTYEVEEGPHDYAETRKRILANRDEVKYAPNGLDLPKGLSRLDTEDVVMISK